MKKWMAMLGLLLVLTGCVGSGTLVSGRQTPSAPESAAGDVPESQTEDPAAENPFPATYTVPEGWVLADEVSTEDMLFYVEEGHENDAMPDNISVHVGACPYSAEEHDTFREAILRQLTMQLGDSGAQLTGDGSTTAQDYTLYRFTIEDQDGAITEQYYILKDYGFALVHVTSFSGSDNTGIFDAAQTIVDSFVWDEDGELQE